MTERRIDLNLGNSGGLGFEQGASAGSGERREASSDDRQRFQAALAPAPASPAAGAAQTAPGVVPSPFALFAAPAAPTAPAAAPAGGALPAGWHDLCERLMVGEGGSGQVVRIELADDALPGVSVSVGEEDGAWLISFECKNDDSRERLCRDAAPLAGEMAARLQRAVLWQVMTDDPEDRRLFEYRSSEEGAP